MKPKRKQEIERIADLLGQGLEVEDIVAVFAEEEQDHFDSLAADWEDDSDAAIERRHGISPDDTFDSRGEPLRPSVNSAGEPWWM